MADVLLAVDPGLARWGWSAWSLEGMPEPMQRVMSREFLAPRLLGFGSESTSPDAKLCERHIKISDDLLKVVRRFSGSGGGVVCVIERPAAMGLPYWRNSQGGRSREAGATMGVGAVSIAAGVMFGTLVAGHAYSVEWVTADNKSKAARWEALKPCLVGATAPLGRTDRTNKEVRDALWYGAKVLCDQRREW